MPTSVSCSPSHAKQGFTLRGAKKDPGKGPTLCLVDTFPKSLIIFEFSCPSPPPQFFHAIELLKKLVGTYVFFNECVFNILEGIIKAL